MFFRPLPFLRKLAKNRDVDIDPDLQPHADPNSGKRVSGSNSLSLEKAKVWTDYTRDWTRQQVSIL
jgi:hypothetical protein